jgi:surface protein
MFSYCDNLKSLDLSSFDTSNVTYMSNMFFKCYELEHVDLSSFDTSNVTAMFNMFNGFQSLTELDISNFDMSKVNDIENMFNAGNSNRTLQHLSFGTNLGKGFTRTSANYSRYILDVSNILELPHDSLMSIINNLYDLNLSYNVANGGRLYTQSLILGSTNMAKLTADEIAIATAKGWNVS